MIRISFVYAPYRHVICLAIQEQNIHIYNLLLNERRRRSNLKLPTILPTNKKQHNKNNTNEASLQSKVVVLMNVK